MVDYAGKMMYVCAHSSRFESLQSAASATESFDASLALSRSVFGVDRVKSMFCRRIDGKSGSLHQNVNLGRNWNFRHTLQAPGPVQTDWDQQKVTDVQVSKKNKMRYRLNFRRTGGLIGGPTTEWTTGAPTTGGWYLVLEKHVCQNNKLW